MTDRLALSNKLDVLETADVAVCGGGLAGVCAALAAREAGLDVVLLEERGALAWEVPHGLNLFLSGGSEITPSLKKVLDAVAAHDGFKNGVLDPVATECVLDKLLFEQGVRTHFRVFPAEADLKSGAVRVTTKSGPLSVKAKVVVDASETSRLAKKAGATFSPVQVAEGEATHARAFLLTSVPTPDEPFALDVTGSSDVVVSPTLWEKEAHVAFTYVAPSTAQSESAARQAMARIIDTLRAKSGYETANLSLSAHESFALKVEKLDPNTLPEGLLVAGPSVLGRRPSLEERARLGQLVAEAAADLLKTVNA